MNSYYCNSFLSKFKNQAAHLDTFQQSLKTILQAMRLKKESDALDTYPHLTLSKLLQGEINIGVMLYPIELATVEEIKKYPFPTLIQLKSSGNFHAILPKKSANQ